MIETHWVIFIYPDWRSAVYPQTTVLLRPNPAHCLFYGSLLNDWEKTWRVFLTCEIVWNQILESKNKTMLVHSHIHLYIQQLCFHTLQQRKPMHTLQFLHHCTGHWGWSRASFKMRMPQTAPVLPQYSNTPTPLHWQVHTHNKKTKEDFECQAFNRHHNISTCIVIMLDGEAPCLLCNVTVAN